jgi:hypothetical protein
MLTSSQRREMRRWWRKVKAACGHKRRVDETWVAVDGTCFNIKVTELY